ncbi:MAG: VanZ family protein [Bacteroidales bacterium]|nr:VanZ family protein [Bacteroidales bacterium]
MKRKAIFITVFVIYLAAVIYLCLMKPDNLPQTELYLFGLPLDKVAHFLMFLPFPALAYMMLWEKGRKTWAELLILLSCLAVGVGLAFLTEHLQAMTQYRSSDIKDIYADMTGLGIGCIVVLINIAIKHIRNRKPAENE